MGCRQAARHMTLTHAFRGSESRQPSNSKDNPEGQGIYQRNEGIPTYTYYECR